MKLPIILTDGKKTSINPATIIAVGITTEDDCHPGESPDTDASCTIYAVNRDNIHIAEPLHAFTDRLHAAGIQTILGKTLHSHAANWHINIAKITHLHFNREDATQSFCYCINDIDMAFALPTATTRNYRKLYPWTEDFIPEKNPDGIDLSRPKKPRGHNGGRKPLPPAQRKEPSTTLRLPSSTVKLADRLAASLNIPRQTVIADALNIHNDLLKNKSQK